MKFNKYFIMLELTAFRRNLVALYFAFNIPTTGATTVMLTFIAPISVQANS